jgi:hypothetical protein
LNNGDEMPRARPQFVHLSEAEVWKAIAEDAGGSVEAEVTRLTVELTVRLMGHTGMQVQARCPIAEVLAAFHGAAPGSFPDGRVWHFQPEETS